MRQAHYWRISSSRLQFFHHTIKYCSFKNFVFSRTSFSHALDIANDWQIFLFENIDILLHIPIQNIGAVIEYGIV